MVGFKDKLWGRSGDEVDLGGVQVAFQNKAPRSVEDGHVTVARPRFFTRKNRPTISTGGLIELRTHLEPTHCYQPLDRNRNLPRFVVFFPHNGGSPDGPLGSVLGCVDWLTKHLVPDVIQRFGPGELVWTGVGAAGSLAILASLRTQPISRGCVAFESLPLEFLEGKDISDKNELEEIQGVWRDSLTLATSGPGCCLHLGCSKASVAPNPGDRQTIESYFGILEVKRLYQQLVGEGWEPRKEVLLEEINLTRNRMEFWSLRAAERILAPDINRS